MRPSFTRDCPGPIGRLDIALVLGPGEGDELCRGCEPHPRGRALLASALSIFLLLVSRARGWNCLNRNVP
jgi:hypothetical protein